MTRQRIVITGIGGLCALGNGAPAIWDAMRNGRSAIGQLVQSPLHDLKTRTGAEIAELPVLGSGKLDLRHLGEMARQRFPA